MADSTNRSKSFLAAEAMCAFVAINEWQSAQVQVALGEADAGDFASDEEANYIATDNPAAWQLFDQRILEAVVVLPEQPGIGRHGRVAGMRELVVLKTRYKVP